MVSIVKWISREDPRFEAEKAQLVVGRDARIYLSYRDPREQGYVLHFRADGSDKQGFAMEPQTALSAVSNLFTHPASTRAFRVIHLQHTAQLRAADGRPVGKFTDLTNTSFDAPQDIAADARGAFYVLDRYANRVVRIRARDPGVVDDEPIDAERVGDPLPIGSAIDAHFSPIALAVHEASERIYLANGEQLKIVDFQGHVITTVMGLGGPLFVADDGTFYTIRPNGTLQQHDGDRVVREISLSLGGRAPDSTYWHTDLGVIGDWVLLKRNHPAELFARYNLVSGRFDRAVSTAHEVMTVTHPGRVWTTGNVPVRVELDTGGPAVTHTWRVWATPFGAADWTELPFSSDGVGVNVPADLGGLYQVKVTTEVTAPGGGSPPDYVVRDIIEVHHLGCSGTINVLTPDNRVHYGRGEEIPLRILARCPDADVPHTVEVAIRRGTTTLATLTVSMSGREGATTLPSAMTRSFREGIYHVVPSAPRLSPAIQTLEIGRGAAAASTYRITFYGDFRHATPVGDVWEGPDVGRCHIRWARTHHLNSFVDRVDDIVKGTSRAFGVTWDSDAAGRDILNEVHDQLARDPHGVAPEKTGLQYTTLATTAAYGAAGMRQMCLLLANDEELPIASDEMSRALDLIREFSAALAPLPGFFGWDWAANWWVRPHWFRDDAEKARWISAAHAAVSPRGLWTDILDDVASRHITWQVEAQRSFKQTLRDAVGEEVASRLRTASSGPYRRPEVYPPLCFSNGDRFASVNEVDGQYQAEQIPWPSWTATVADFYRRPGKPIWIHPELMNDCGTGEQFFPCTWLAVMRGVDGVGFVNVSLEWGEPPLDARHGYHGLPSIARHLFSTIEQLGPWIQSTRSADPVAIVVSRRMLALDTFLGGRDWTLGKGTNAGLHFTRLWEAFMSSLYARRPASFVFAEDKTADTWSRFRAVLIVDQRVEPEASWSDAIRDARAAGLPIFADATSTIDLPGVTRLGVAFTGIETISTLDDDGAYWAVPERLVANATAIAASVPFASAVGPVAHVDRPEVLVSRRVAGAGQFYWVVNNTHNPLPPEQLYRVNLAVSSLVPAVAKIGGFPGGGAIYDVTARRLATLTSAGTLTADLRAMGARLYAWLPRPIGRLVLHAPAQVRPGDPVSWSVVVEDDRGSPMDASLPVRFTVRDGATEVHAQNTFANAGAGARGSFVPPDGARELHLAAVDLVSGQIAASTVRVGAAPRLRPIPLPPTLDNIAPVDRFGPRLRDVVVDSRGAAYVSAHAWGDNLYAIDLETGAVRWQRRIGDAWALSPARFGDGVTVTGFDLRSAEGYHLHVVDRDGAISRRFALYGLPQQMAASFQMANRPNHPRAGFAVSPKGDWVAASGDLGVVVWSAAGTVLWSIDRWRSGSRVEPALIGASETGALLVVDEPNVTAHDPMTGRPLWHLELQSTDGRVRQVRPRTGQITRMSVALVLDSGTVLIVRAHDGEVLHRLPGRGTEVDFFSEGTPIATLDGHPRIALIDGHRLDLLEPYKHVAWSFRANAPLHFPRFSQDGQWVAVSAEDGHIILLDAARGAPRSFDLGSVAVPAWLPDGDLLAVGWLGEVTRLAVADEIAPRWRSRLPFGVLPRFPPAPETVQATRMLGWSNAVATRSAVLGGRVEVHVYRNEREVQGTFDPRLWFAPDAGDAHTPFFAAGDMCPDRSIGKRTRIVLKCLLGDRGTQLRRVHLEGISFHEDAARPETWMRDVNISVWDDVAQQWLLTQRLLSDAAEHRHHLSPALEGSTFRLSLPPYFHGNLCFSSIQLHGRDLT